MSNAMMVISLCQNFYCPIIVIDISKGMTLKLHPPSPMSFIFAQFSGKQIIG